MALPRVLPDTNVCYPISLLDLVLRLDEADLHRVIWSDDLLGELERTWIANGARSASSAVSICNDIRTAFPDGRVPREAYEHLIDEMPGKDPDDHPHAAAAVARAPSVILTSNVADFPKGPLARRGVTVTRPDPYLCEMLEAHPDEIGVVIAEMAADRQRPPLTTDDVIDALAGAGVKAFAAQLRSRGGA
jgi:hypothetical protein